MPNVSMEKIKLLVLGKGRISETRIGVELRNGHIPTYLSGEAFN